MDRSVRSGAFTVREVIQQSNRTRILRIDIGDTGFKYIAGQAILAGVGDLASRSPYSIATAPVEAARSGFIELLQSRSTGVAQSWVERVGALGQQIVIEGPFGELGESIRRTNCPILMIAGGTGIAPLRSILMQVLDTQPQRQVSLVYSARCGDEFAFRDQFEALARSHHIRLYLTVTGDSTGWSGRRGRIDKELLALALPAPDSACLLCGPDAFVAGAREIVLGLGVRADAIFAER